MTLLEINECLEGLHFDSLFRLTTTYLFFFQTRLVEVNVRVSHPTR